jgi:uncharacterized protein
LQQALAAARSFRPLSAAERQQLLAKTYKVAMTGKFEMYKTGQIFDGTTHHPEWMG